jgi:hypothetical protein
MSPLRLALLAAGFGSLLAPASAHAAPRCHTAGLSGRLGRVDAGAGSRFVPLVLRNTSSHTCTLRGYIGGRLEGLETHVVRVGGTPVSTVTVRPGKAAVSDIRWSAIPADTTGCPTPTTFAVTPPDETAQLRVKWRGGEVCGGGRIDVRPLRAQRRPKRSSQQPLRRP